MAEEAGPTPTPVGIALIGRDGEYLIRRRPVGGPMPGYWEFPGGKCEPGESPEAATRRECVEEVGFGVAIVGLRRVVTHHYPHGLVRLYYFECVPEDPAAQPAAGSGFRWVRGRDLPALRFPEANELILRELAEATDRGGPPPSP